MVRHARVETFRTAGWLAMALALGAGPAGAKDYYLVAKPFTKAMPDGVTIPMWGFGQDVDGNGDGQGDCYQTTDLACPVPATAPGPILSLAQNQRDLRIFVLNLLPEPISIVIAGHELPAGSAPVWTDGTSGSRTSPTQRVRSFTGEAAPAGGKRAYEWGSATGNALEPGTYLYQSGTHPQVQVQMGLYGALENLAPNAGGTRQAYPGVPFDNELTLFFSTIDPALHEAVDEGSYGTSGPTSTLDHDPKYFLVNGNPYSATTTCIDPSPRLRRQDRILLRLLNAGLDELVPMILASRWQVVAEGGSRQAFPTDQYTALLQAGSTKDLVWTPGRTGEFRIIERRLNLTNHEQPNGGMQTCIRIR